MRRFHCFVAVAVLIVSVAAFAVIAQAGEKCCECGCEQKLKKIYCPVVTFKEVTFKSKTYSTVCQEVKVPTSTCCDTCGGCDSKCDGGCDSKCNCSGKSKTISVPVAVPCGCKTCTRKVACVTWTVKCVCEPCCKKCKHHSKPEYCSGGKGCDCGRQGCDSRQ